MSLGLEYNCYVFTSIFGFNFFLLFFFCCLTFYNWIQILCELVYLASTTPEFSWERILSKEICLSTWQWLTRESWILLLITPFLFFFLYTNLSLFPHFFLILVSNKYPFVTSIFWCLIFGIRRKRTLIHFCTPDITFILDRHEYFFRNCR